MQEPRDRRGFKKKAVALVIVILALLGAIGATYAWRDYNQHKTNLASYVMPKYDATLVEDYREIKNWKVDDGAVTKEISVKNTGIASQGFEEVYVRIQLKEYMDFSPMNKTETRDRYMIDTNGNFIWFPTEAAARAAYPNAPFDLVQGGYSQLTDAVSGVTGWFIPTKEGDDNGQYGKHIVTEYGLGAKEWLVGDSSMETAYREANKTRRHDIKPNGECAYPVHEWEGTDLANVLAQPGAVDYIKWVLGADVVLYTDWANPESAWYSSVDGNGDLRTSYGPYWIIDDRPNGDGWVYWAQALFPGQQTSNFLESIELILQPAGDFSYRIHTEMEAVSLDELFKTDREWNDMPGSIRDSWQSNSPQVVILEGGAPAQATYTIKRGESLDLSALVKPDTVDQTLVWTFGGNASSVRSNQTLPFTGTGLTVTGIKEGTATVVAKSTALGKEMTIVIRVTDEMTKLFELEELIARCKKAIEDEALYTPESYLDAELEIVTPLAEAAVEQGITDEDDLQTWIDILTEALGKLERKVSLEDQLKQWIVDGKEILALPRDINEDHSITGDDDANIYKPEWLDELQRAIEDAEDLLAKRSPAATDEELEEAIEKIGTLLENPVLKPDKSGLRNAITLANGLNKDEFTTSTWGPFEDAYNEAIRIAREPNATEEQVADALRNLEEAMGSAPYLTPPGLVRRGIADALNTLINNSRAAETKAAPSYTANSLAALDEALQQTGRTTPVDTRDLTQDEIDALIAILQPAYDGLVDLSGLAASVADANGRDPLSYINWDDVLVDTDILADAIRVLNDPAATQTEVNDAKNALDAALLLLTEGDPLGDLAAALAGAKNEVDYTSATWTSSGYGAAKAVLVGLSEQLAGNSSLYPATITPAMIYDAIAALNIADAKTPVEGGLVLRVDPAVLLARVGTAKDGLDIDGRYTANSMGALNTAIGAANTALDGYNDATSTTKPWPDQDATAQAAQITAINDARANLVSIGDLLDALAASPATNTGPWTAASWATYSSHRTAANTLATNAQSAANVITAAQVATALSNLNAPTYGLVLAPVVTNFTVAAASSATGGTQAATSANFTLNMQRHATAEQVITLTGNPTGTNMPSPALTTWTKGASNAAWGPANGDATTFVITIPIGATGTFTVTAKAKDGSQSLVVTVNVVDFTLRYSEGNMLYGATTESATTTAANAFTINLATPQGAATTRFFTTRNAADSVNFTVPVARWVLSDVSGDPYAGSNPLTQVTAGQCYGVRVPVGYEGSFRLTIDGVYTITFNVTPTGGTNVGETWGRDGIDWRILAKSGGNTLVIAEHIQLDQRINGTTTNWDNAIKWAGSELRADLNGSGAAGTRAAKTWYEARNLGSLGIVPTTINTRVGWNDVRYGGYEPLANQSFFLLSEEEVFRTLTWAGTQTPDLGQNLFPGSVLFPDALSRRSTSLASNTWWWLRSPSFNAGRAAVVGASAGGANAGGVSVARGVRPAFVTNLIP